MRGGFERGAGAGWIGMDAKTERHAGVRPQRVLVSAPGEIRTPGLLIRSQMLYPAELRAHGMGWAEGIEPSIYRVTAGRDNHFTTPTM